VSKLIPIPESPTPSLVDALRAQLAHWEARRPGRDTSLISSGCQALDRLLPGGGLPRGALIECLEDEAGAGGAGMVGLILARQAAAEGGALVILDSRHSFYPPAAAVLGIDLDKLLVVRASQARDQFWALDQCLRCPAVAAVWAPLEQLSPRDFRRLQLAAECGGGLGVLVRGSVARQQPSWSALQLWIHPQAWRTEDLRTGRRLRVELARCRQARSGGTIELEMDEVTGVMQAVSYPHEAYPLHPTAELAHTAAGHRSARA
jgi:protein ImuA